MYDTSIFGVNFPSFLPPSLPLSLPPFLPPSLPSFLPFLTVIGLTDQDNSVVTECLTFRQTFGKVPHNSLLEKSRNTSCVIGQAAFLSETWMEKKKKTCLSNLWIKLDKITNILGNGIETQDFYGMSPEPNRTDSVRVYSSHNENMRLRDGLCWLLYREYP